jgi:hypothetical protein
MRASATPLKRGVNENRPAEYIWFAYTAELTCSAKLTAPKNPVLRPAADGRECTMANPANGFAFRGPCVYSLIPMMTAVSIVQGGIPLRSL